MKQIDKESQPSIVKYVENEHVGIHLMKLTRCAIGYVQRGSKYIYYGDERHTINKGEIFYMGGGNHYVEERLDEGKPYEEIVIYYSPSQLQRILLNLNMAHSINITNTHLCDRCRRQTHISMPATSVMRSYFTHLTSYLQENSFMHDEAAEDMKMTELIYLIISQRDCCLKSKVLSNVDSANDNFEQIIYSNIFSDLAIEELATMCNRSLTSFKKEFKRHFFMPPHRWFIKQRLIQSRLLLISTSKSISEIGIECTFPNTSHFIKLFKKQYGTTPAIYRSTHCNMDAMDSAASENNSKEANETEEQIESMAM